MIPGILLLVIGAAFAAPGAAPAALRLVESAATYAVLEYAGPSPTLEPAVVGSRRYVRVQVPGLVSAGTPGHPELPAAGCLLGIPFGARLTVRVLESDPGRVDDCDVLPAARLVPHPASPGQLTPSAVNDGYERVADARVYARAGLVPEPVRLGTPSQIRSQAVVPVQVAPVQYDPVGHRLTFFRRLRFRIDFSGGASGAMLAETAPYEQVLSRSVINYEQARYWRMNPVRTPRRSLPARAGQAWKLSVNRPGVYQLTRSFLDSCGVSLAGLDPRTLRILNRNRELPILVRGEGDGSFDDGDEILFYGLPETTRFTTSNVYWLASGPTPGRRMALAGGTPSGTFATPHDFRARLHLERDVYYLRMLPGSDSSTRFYGKLFYAPPAMSDTVLAELHGISDSAAATRNAQLTYVLAGYNEYDVLPDHHAVVEFNGAIVDSCRWDGRTRIERSMPLPMTALKDGANTVRVTVPGDASPFDMVVLDWVELEYWRTYVAVDESLTARAETAGRQTFRLCGLTADSLELYDITVPDSVRCITGFERHGDTLVFEDSARAGAVYRAQAQLHRLRPVAVVLDTASALASPDNQADYLVIAWPPLIPALGPLLAERRSEGWQTMVVSITDVFDEFSAGVFYPDAIRDFLAYAYANWRRPAPTFVLLVGDETFDHRNIMGYNVASQVPSHHMGSSEDNAEIASDNWFACVAGDDFFADYLIGRFPAGTAVQAQTMVEKTVAYETATWDEPWRTSALLIADNPDEVGDFEAASENLAGHFPPEFALARVYMTGFGSGSAARDSINAALNRGAVVANYFGHGAPQQLAYEPMYRNPDVGQLMNSGMLTVLSTMTCNTGYFDIPRVRCLAETLCDAVDKGAVACFAPSGFGITPVHDIMARAYYDEFFENSDYILGSAATAAKYAAVAQSSVFADHAEMFTLFGDPALEVAFPNRPDLVPDELVLDPARATEGDTVSIAVTVHNAGRIAADSARLRFAIDDSVLTTLVLPHLPPRDSVRVGTDWYSAGRDGRHEVVVRVNPDSSLAESALWNNTVRDSLVVDSLPTPPGVEEDGVPPRVSFTVDGTPGFPDYDFTSASPEIVVEVRDESGLDPNATAATLNGAVVAPVVTGTVPEGGTRLTYRFADLADGTHRFTFVCADRYHNRTEKNLAFVVESRVMVRTPLAYPNPSRGEVWFSYLLSQSCQSVSVRIYTVAGRRVAELRNCPARRNYNSVRWDGRDDSGVPLANGIYLLRIAAEDWQGRHAESVGRFVVER